MKYAFNTIVSESQSHLEIVRSVADIQIALALQRPQSGDSEAEAQIVMKP